jgi:Chalcone isomerase-like
VVIPTTQAVGAAGTIGVDRSMNLALRLTRRDHLLWLAGAAVPALAPAGADTVIVEGQTFPRRLPLAGAELLLNGTGIRAVAWFKGYVAALYLSERTRLPAQALAMPGPKRLRLVMLHEAPADELVKALNKGVLRNTEPNAQSALAERLAQLGSAMKAMGAVKKGSVIDLDHEPDRGTVFSFNGTLRGAAIAGDDFYAALLRSFVGERPYDTKLKAGLLGQAEG